MNSNPIVVEQTYDAPVVVVWKAITEKDQMRQWYFEPMAEFEPVVGFETRFNVHCEDKDYLHVWKVNSVVPPKLIAYTWRYEGYPGDSTVTWELSKVGDGTHLKLTHAGHETLQGDPIFSRENCLAGWKYFVQESLKSFLDQQDS